MGNYLNPGNIGFEEIRNSQYVDKSGLIALINDTIGTKQKLACIRRPRRFGKSFAAQMLCAYYDKTCDSSALFEDLEISTNEKLNRTYKQYLNRYDVIYLDMTAVIGAANGKEDVVPFVIRNVTKELAAAYPHVKVEEAFFATLATPYLLQETSLLWSLMNGTLQSGKQVISQLYRKNIWSFCVPCLKTAE